MDLPYQRLDSKTRDQTGSLPAIKRETFGLLAQLAERFHGMEEAAGSSPVQSTSLINSTET